LTKSKADKEREDKIAEKEAQEKYWTGVTEKYPLIGFKDSDHPQ